MKEVQLKKKKNNNFQLHKELFLLDNKKRVYTKYITLLGCLTKEGHSLLLPQPIISSNIISCTKEGQ